MMAEALADAHDHARLERSNIGEEAKFQNDKDCEYSMYIHYLIVNNTTNTCHLIATHLIQLEILEKLSNLPRMKVLL